MIREETRRLEKLDTIFGTRRSEKRQNTSVLEKGIERGEVEKGHKVQVAEIRKGRFGS